MKRLLVVAMITACSSPSGDTGSDAPPGGGSADAATQSDAPPAVAKCMGLATQPLDKQWTIATAAGDRQAQVHVPASYDPTKATPVVIDIHGLTSFGADQARIAHMIAKSDAEGFIAVHPEGTGIPKSWNAGYCCSPANGSGVNDVAFISTMIDKLATELCVDPDRVFAMGLSNGGYLSHRLACELSDKIAAIGPVAGVIGIASCNPTRAVPVFDVHGTADPLVPWNGGNGQQSVPQTIDFWVQHNGCTTMTPSYAHGDASCVTHGGCTNGADVTLCTIDNGGHQWPGGESIGAILGKKSDDLIATDAIWTFFAAHPRH